MTPTQQSAGLVERLEEDDALRRAYEADMIARMRRGGLSGSPYLKRGKDGAYKRTDLEADYQAFRASMLAPSRSTTPTADEGGENV